MSREENHYNHRFIFDCNRNQIYLVVQNRVECNKIFKYQIATAERVTRLRTHVTTSVIYII